MQTLLMFCGGMISVWLFAKLLTGKPFNFRSVLSKLREISSSWRCLLVVRAMVRTEIHQEDAHCPSSGSNFNSTWLMRRVNPVTGNSTRDTLLCSDWPTSELSLSGSRVEILPCYGKCVDRLFMRWSHLIAAKANSHLPHDEWNM